MSSWTLETDQAKLAVRVSEPFTATAVDETNDPGWVRTGPGPLTKLPCGRLVMAAGLHADGVSGGSLMLDSEDGGRTWRETLNWPTATERGRHLHTGHLALPDGASLVFMQTLFTSEEPDVFVLPTWRSADGGNTWGPLEPARVELPLGVPFVPMDRFDPPEWYLRSLPPQFVERLRRTPEPLPELVPVRERFGRQTIGARFSPCVLEDGRLLSFIYLTPRPGDPHIVVCVASDDAGRTWSYLSTPGPWEPRYATENFLTHAVDGLCEPSMTQLESGELLLVMRLGSWHPLYATQSADGGRTWTSPRALPVWGIMPTVLALPCGAVALASGRPHVTLSFSLDRGYRWPYTIRFLEDGKPEDPSTRNTAMIQVEPNRLLHMYDHGGYHPLPEEFKGKRRIVGHFIDVELAQ